MKYSGKYIMFFMLTITLKVIATGNKGDNEHSKQFKPLSKCSEIENLRVKELDQIANEQGDFQSYSVATYDEYLCIGQLLNINKKAKFFHTAKLALEQMITEFKQKHTQITISHIDQLKEEIRKEEDFEESNVDCQLKQNIVKSKNLAEDGINLYQAVIYSKLFMRKAYSVGGPASWLNIYSFAQYISDLEIITQLSRLQSKAINLLIFDSIYTEHVGNKQKTKLHGKAIVVGCGPAGLYSSFYAFESGMSIDRVDDRNCFTRTHIVRLDPMWTAQLVYFLGTYYDRLFVGDTSIGTSLGKYNEYVRANLKELETALDFQLSLLGKYVRCKTDTSSNLSHIIKAAVNRIQFPTQELPHFTAKLDTGKNAVTSDPGQGIEFNFMIISSGAKSRLRSAYVNVPTDETVKERYSVATFVKGSKLSGIMLVPDEKEGFVTGNRLDSLKAFENMQTLGPFLKEEHIGEQIQASTFLSEKIRKRYSHIHNMMIHGMEMAENGPKVAKQCPEKVEVKYGLVENGTNINIGESQRQLWPNFFNELALEDKNNSIECDRLMMQLNRKYLKALTEAKLHQTIVLEGEHINTRNIISIDQKGNASEENPSKLHFDPVSVNTSTFNLTQMSMKYSATQYTADYIKGEPKVPSAIMVTFGDAFATPHHLTGSGLSTLRLGIEIMKSTVIKFGKKNATHLVGILNGRMAKVRNLALEKGSKHVNLLTDDERNASSFNRMCETINDVKNRANIFGINGFKIVSDGEVSAKNSTFGIEIDGHKTYMAEVTKPLGKIKINEMPKKKYSAIMQAVFVAITMSRKLGQSQK